MAFTSHPPLLALGYAEASALLERPGAGGVKAVLAIHGLHEFAVEAPGVPHRTVLSFDDIDAPDSDDPFSMHAFRMSQRRNAEIGLHLTPPAPEHAAAIIEFARSVRDLDGLVLCHCHAGISRSTAAALLCLAAWSEAGGESHCVHQLFRIRPHAVPHDGLVLFGDRLLRREGRLVRALEESQRL